MYVNNVNIDTVLALL